MDIKPIVLPPLRVAAVEHTGAYSEIGAKFGQLFGWARKSGLIGKAPTFVGAPWGIGIYYDNPMNTPVEDLRSVACVAVPDDFPIEGDDIKEMHLPGGSFLSTSHLGPYSTLQTAWPAFMGQVVTQVNHQPDFERPCMELYVNDCNTTPEDQVRTDLLAPIKS